MKVDRLISLVRLPGPQDPPVVVDVPVGIQAVVFRVITDKSTKFGCTADDSIWFPCPLPVVFRETDSELTMVLHLSHGALDVGDLGYYDYQVEFGVIR